MQGYQALRTGTAWIDLAQRGKIRATGEDRARLLHAMTTNHVQQLAPGQGVYAFFLNAQGRVLSDVNLFCLEGALLLDLEPETTQKIYEHLDKFIIADDVTLEDVTKTLPTVGLEGPGAEETLTTVGAPAPAGPHDIAVWGNRWIARFSQTGSEGFSIFVPSRERPDLISMLETAGAVEAAPDAVEAVRLENGRPRYGQDFSEKTLPQETGLMHALHFQKGCYLGQEIVERIRSRALLHRGLVKMRLQTAQAPPPNTEVHDGELKVGDITSSAFSPALEQVVALGYVRKDYMKPCASLTAMGGVPVEILV